MLQGKSIIIIYKPYIGKVNITEINNLNISNTFKRFPAFINVRRYDVEFFLCFSLSRVTNYSSHCRERKCIVWGMTDRAKSRPTQVTFLTIKQTNKFKPAFQNIFISHFFLRYQISVCVLLLRRTKIMTDAYNFHVLSNFQTMNLECFLK